LFSKLQKSMRSQVRLITDRSCTAIGHRELVIIFIPYSKEFENSVSLRSEIKARGRLESTGKQPLRIPAPICPGIRQSRSQPKTLATWLAKDMGSNGLAITLTTPKSANIRLSLARALAVSKMTGMCCVALLACNC
jgi:hypothetical protein